MHGLARGVRVVGGWSRARSRIACLAGGPRVRPMRGRRPCGARFFAKKYHLGSGLSATKRPTSSCADSASIQSCRSRMKAEGSRCASARRGCAAWTHGDSTQRALEQRPRALVDVFMCLISELVFIRTLCSSTRSLPRHICAIRVALRSVANRAAACRARSAAYASTAGSRPLRRSAMLRHGNTAHVAQEASSRVGNATSQRQQNRADASALPCSLEMRPGRALEH